MLVLFLERLAALASSLVFCNTTSSRQYIDALCVQVTTLTVYALLEAASTASQGKWLVQTAGGSTLGRQIISLAKHRGIRLVSLVRRAAQKEELLSLG